MGRLDAFFTRRRKVPRFASLPRRTRHHLVVVCEDLTEFEDEMARRLGLDTPPRLILVDEEEAVILLPDDRAGTR